MFATMQSTIAASASMQSFQVSKKVWLANFVFFDGFSESGMKIA